MRTEIKQATNYKGILYRVFHTFTYDFTFHSYVQIRFIISYRIVFLGC